MSETPASEPITYEGKTVAEWAAEMHRLCGNRADAQYAAEMRARHALKHESKNFFAAVAAWLSDG